MSAIRSSLVVIAQDCAALLPRCLTSAPFVDEIIVLDGGSRDDTREVARSLGAIVRTRRFDNTLDQKRWATRAARGEWILSLDADECLSEELATSMSSFLRKPEHFEGAEVRRRNHVYGVALRRGGWYPDQRLRLARRSSARWEGRSPHDLLSCDGETILLEGDLLHFPYRTRAEHRQKLERHAREWARSAHAAGRRPRPGGAWIRPAWTMLQRGLLQGGLLEGAVGREATYLWALYEHRKALLLRQEHLLGGTDSSGEGFTR